MMRETIHFCLPGNSRHIAAATWLTKILEVGYAWVALMAPLTPVAQKAVTLEDSRW